MTSSPGRRHGLPAPPGPAARRGPDGYPGDSRPPPWLGDPDRRDDDDVEFCVEDEEPG